MTKVSWSSRDWVLTAALVLFIALSWEADMYLFESPQSPCFLKGSSWLTAEFPMSPMDIQTHVCLKPYFSSLMTFKKSIYLFVAALGLGAGSRDYSLVAVHRLLWCRAQALGCVAQWLWHKGLTAPWHVESPQTRDRTSVPCIGRCILNHRTTKELLSWHFWGGELERVWVFPSFFPWPPKEHFAVFSETLGW